MWRGEEKRWSLNLRDSVWYRLICTEHVLWTQNDKHKSRNSNRHVNLKGKESYYITKDKEQTMEEKKEKKGSEKNYKMTKI